METFIGIVLGVALVWLATMVYAERQRANNCAARFEELRALYDAELVRYADLYAVLTESNRLYDEQAEIRRKQTALIDELMGARRLTPFGPEFVRPYSLMQKN